MIELKKIYKYIVNHYSLYFLKEFIPPFSLIFFFFIVLFNVFQSLKLTELVLVRGADIQKIFAIFGYFSLSYFPMFGPICLLAAFLIVFGRMSNDSEITAFRSLGYSNFKLIIPPILLTLVLMIPFNVIVNDWSPKSNLKAKNLLFQLAQKAALVNLQPGTFLTKIPGVTLYGNDISKSSNTLSKVFILDQREVNEPRLILAKSLKIKSNPNTGASFLFNKGEIFFNQDKLNSTLKFDEYDLNLSEVVKNKGKKRIKTSELTTKEIKYLIRNEKRNTTSGISSKLKEAQWYQLYRGQMNLSLFIFGLFGIILGIQLKQRKKTPSALIVCIIFSISYWGLFSIFQSISLNTINLLIIVPNLLFLLVAYWLYKKRFKAA